MARDDSYSLLCVWTVYKYVVLTSVGASRDGHGIAMQECSAVSKSSIRSINGLYF